MRILITGNAGFVGGYLTEALLAEGHTVSGLDKRTMRSDRHNVDCHTGNILDKVSVIKAMSGCELVYHLAAEHQDWGVPHEAYYETNQRGTRVLLDAAAELGVQRFVFFSSVSVYGAPRIPPTETTEPEPNNDYGGSKLAGEQEILAWTAQDPNRSVLIVRPTVIFGPRMNDYSNIYRLVDQIARHRFILVGSMANIKSLGYVENVVDAALFLSRELKPGVVINNITEREQISARATALYIAKALRVPLLPVGLPYRPILAAASVLDVIAARIGVNLPITAARIKKLNATTHFRSDKLYQSGFHPKYSIFEGLEKACAWYAEQRR